MSQGGQIDTLRIALLNCHGAEGKLDTMKLVCKAETDIILLTETWSHSDDALPNLPNFVQWSTARPKARKKAGRHAGGIAMYIKEKYAKYMTLVSTDASKDKMWAKLDKAAGLGADLHICLLYLPPESSKPSRAKIAKVYETLTEEISLSKEKGFVLIAGDLNARTGLLQEAASMKGGIPDHLQPDIEFLPPRTSEDAAGGTNFSGRSLIEMCDKADLAIVNGRIPGDLKGAYTHQSYHRGKDKTGGQSLVDYFVADRHMYQQCVQDLSVSETVINSDHSLLMLELELDSSCHLDCDNNQKAAPLRFFLPAEKHEEYLEMLSDDPRLNCQLLQSKTDTLSAAVSVQKIIFDVATECFGKQARNPKNTFPSNEWYDSECKELQVKFLGLVKSGANLDDRMAARKAYRTLVRSKKRQHKLKQAEELCRLDPSTFWKRYRGPRKPLRLRDKNVWERHFSTLYSAGNQDLQSASQVNDSAAGLECTNRLFNPHGAATLNQPFSVKEVEGAISRMKNNKAAGKDGIKPEFLKIGKEALAPPLSVVLNMLFLDGTYPPEWSQGVIVPIFKAGDTMDASNYRGITLVPMLDKLYAILLCTRISRWAEENKLRAPSQAGFRKDHRTSDQLFIHRTIVETSIYEKKPLFCAYIDYSKAFDTIPRHLLWERLAEIGIHGHMLKAIKAMYQDVKACVSTPEGYTQDFVREKGVKQGCALSPLLFGLYIDELHKILQREAKECQPPYIGGEPVGLSLFADDSKLYAWSSVGLQCALNLMASFSVEKGLTPNPKKTKIMVWKNSRQLKKEDLIWTLNGERIDVVKEHIDLGLLVSQTQTARYNWAASCSQPLIRAATVKLHSISRRAREIGVLSPKMMCRLFDTLIRPSLTYGSEIWGVELGMLDHDKTGSVGNAVERVHLRYLKRTLGVKQSTPSSHVRGEFGRFPVVLNIWSLIIKYYCRLEEMDGDRLLRKAYDQSKFLASQGMCSWYHYAMQGLQQLAENFEFKNTIFLSDRLKELHCQKWLNDLHQGGTKAAIYREITGGVLESRAYLEVVKSKANRRMLASFRTGSHALRVETGRWISEAHSSRVCPVCTSGSVESEHHFLFECHLYDEIRSRKKFGVLFKVPWCLRTVLQDHSPLVCDFMSLCYEHRDAQLK
jgi:exonuclease III